RTGLLAYSARADAFGAVLKRLATTPELRRELGQNARAFVRAERDLTGASAILRRTLASVVGSSRDGTGADV
ncbi:MAG: hypothetical protein AAGJ53_01230, partial [Pseudomonadota bacterium]